MNHNHFLLQGFSSFLNPLENHNMMALNPEDKVDLIKQLLIVISMYNITNIHMNNKIL
jgi:hypothetical protein